LGRARRPGDEGAIVVVATGERLCGLLVGEVRDFLELPASDVAGRDRLPGVDPRVVRAVARHGADHVVILDLDALLEPVIGT